MTDKQLAVLLHSKLRALQDAVSEVEKELPEEYRREYNSYIGIKDTYYPILTPIRNVILDMSYNIDILIGEEG